MFIAAAVAGVFAIRHGHDWDAIQRSTGEKFASVLPVILILLHHDRLLIGTWMFSGTIPALVYYGVQLVNPRFMIVTAFLITAMMSMTGSSLGSGRNHWCRVNGRCCHHQRPVGCHRRRGGI